MRGNVRVLKGGRKADKKKKAPAKKAKAKKSKTSKKSKGGKKMKKVKFGGKGVGRLLWLKVAEKVEVSSKYVSDVGVASIKFDFVADPDEPISNLVEGAATGDVGTTVRLTPLKIAYALHIPAKLETVAVRTVAHFINYFVNISCPKITLMGSKNSIILFDKFTDDVVRDKKYPIQITVDGEERKLSNFS